MSGGTDLIAQPGLDGVRVNLDLPIEDAGEVANGTDGGTRNGKERPVEYFDLSHGSASLRSWEEGDHIILDLLRARGVSEEELVCEIWKFLDDLFQRNVLRARREEADAQAVIDEGLGLHPIVESGGHSLSDT